jgi:hypothetical protein
VAAKQDTRPYALIDLYALLYQQKMKRKASVNKYRDKWGFMDMLDALDYERSVEVVQYYFTLERADYPLIYLFSNFDRLDVQIKARDEDRANRRKLMKQTQERVEGK